MPSTPTTFGNSADKLMTSEKSEKVAQGHQSQSSPPVKKAGKASGKKRDGGPDREGMHIPRTFTTAGRDPFDDVEWELRTAAITGEGGKVYFEQKDVEIPRSWSQTATNVVVQKYF